MEDSTSSSPKPMTPQGIAHDIVMYAVGTMGVEMNTTQQVELEYHVSRAITMAWEQSAVVATMMMTSMLHTLN